MTTPNLFESSIPREPYRIYIGIDNGLTGALAAVRSDRMILEMMAMPTRGKAKGNEVDAKSVWEWIRKFDHASVVLETPGKFSKGKMSLTPMWDSYGALRGVLESHDIRHHRITPQMWQKLMLPGCGKGDTKPAAKAKARQLWPEQRWLKTERCKKQDPGLIDAALIAEYARLQRL